MKRAGIVALIVLGVVVLTFLYLNLNKKRHNWAETYASKSNEPFGTLFIQELIKSYAHEGFTHNTKKKLYELLDSATHNANSTYVFMGQSWQTDSLGIEAMLRYLTAGNDAFIISNYTADKLLNAMYKSECTSSLEFEQKSIATVKADFYHPQFSASRPYTFTFRIKGEDENYFWQYLNTDALCDSATSVVPLGFFDADYVNFFKIPYGKGHLYIHTNPIIFTNYFMLSERNTEYASFVLSHSQHRRIIWDDFKKGFSFQRNPRAYNNPLYYIMEQPALRYAWWALILMVLLYVLFIAKRLQRSIPVIEKKVNSSLAFLKMVSSLYYHNQNHADIAQKKMRFFLHMVRTRYGLQTHIIDQEFIKKLSLKSTVSEAEVELIFNQFKIIDNFQDIDSAPMVNLYKAIQNFYNKAK